MVNGEYLSLRNSDDTYCADIASRWNPSLWKGQECMCRLACRQSDQAPVLVYAVGDKLLGVEPLPADRRAA